MKSVIAAQQSYAKTTGISEVCCIEDIVDTALAISEAALKNASIVVATEFAGVEPALLDRHQVLQILINLISNAKHAVQENDVGNRKIAITTVQRDGCFTLEISDNGIGIEAEDFPMIFNHGFTTKKTGHGFGLHNCANAAREMDGSLVAHSDGPGAGARFILTLPANSADRQAIHTGAA
jgi:C4-dicarboxylate-specific signal transduction histidine kinase